MEELEILLTDEYVEFARVVKDTHDKKKEKQEEFKVVYDNFKNEMKEYDSDVATAQNRFEAWKKTLVEKDSKPKS